MEPTQWAGKARACKGIWDKRHPLCAYELSQSFSRTVPCSYSKEMWGIRIFGQTFYFCYRSYSNTVQSATAKLTDNLKPLKTLKTCTKRWLTDGDTSAHVVSRFKQVVYGPDILTTEKHKTIAQILDVKCYLLSPFYCRFCLLEHLCLSIIFVCRDTEIWITA